MAFAAVIFMKLVCWTTFCKRNFMKISKAVGVCYYVTKGQTDRLVCCLNSVTQLIARTK